ncbi:DUF7319 domain-containing protein [Halobacterium zhouii]|uniref:DUF7319 domain-containing protein n=1 Tax=Halobacterium zhouii TaxID=2902624 RepID=UPI001E581B1A|nr:hypothetical protein [Halobacterium zhouii]
MTDSSPDEDAASASEEPEHDEADPANGVEDDSTMPEADAESESQSAEDLREEVEEAYDFEEFGPREMDEMSAAEWEAAFDPDTWIIGEDLLDRVEADLRHRVATRDVFAVVERTTIDSEPVVLAYSDEGYAVVYPDGSVEGRGTVLRDVKPTVALCSMDDYDTPEPPEEAGLPDPAEVPEGSGGFGTTVLQYVGIAQVAAGVFLFLSPFTYDPLVRSCPPVPGSPAHACTIAGTTLRLHPLGQSAVIAALAGVGFVLFGALILLIVANARLSDRFRSEQFRERLRAAGVDSDERPAFVPETDGDE